MHIASILLGLKSDKQFLGNSRKNNRGIEDFFNDNSSIYFANKYFTIKRGSFVKSFIDEGDRILDVGIGAGDLAPYYSNGILTGCDISRKMIERARKELPESRLSVGDAERLHYESESFDVLVASEMIYYLAHPEELLAEADRVLKPAGKLILMWGNSYLNSLYNLASYLRLRAHDPYALQTPSKGYVEELVRTVFREASVRSFGIGMPGILNGTDHAILAKASPILGLVIQKH